MTDMKRWAYAQLHDNYSLMRAVGLKMLYLALAGAYEASDLDFVATLTERIKEKVG